KAAEIGAETLAETSSATLLRQLRGEEPCHMKTAELAQYSLQDNCILRNDRVYIPEKLRQRVLTELHQGHLGMVKCKSLARSYVYWPGIDHDIEDMVRSCASCDQNAKNPSKCVSHPWLPPSQPWQRIHFDFGEIENTNLLIIVDAYAKWPEVFVVKSTNSAQVIECFEKCFSRFGLPEVKKLNFAYFVVLKNGKLDPFLVNWEMYLCRTNLDEFNSAILIDDPAPDSAPIIPDQAEPELPIQPQPAVRRSSRIRRQPQWFQPS
ncbi:unnamed protein product, partial [Allacma fusca]